jgi:hypothetical protein
MKIGLSYSRCVLDIVEGRVDLKDVLVIIARTDFDPNDDKSWSEIWRGYTTSSGWIAPAWKDYAPDDGKAEAQFRNVTTVLYSEGVLHQPRQFGVRPARLPYHWLEAVLPSEELEHNPAAREAWQRFQVIAGLAGVKMDHEFY